jgi:hypothetical protein
MYSQCFFFFFCSVIQGALGISWMDLREYNKEWKGQAGKCSTRVFCFIWFMCWFWIPFVWTKFFFQKQLDRNCIKQFDLSPSQRGPGPGLDSSPFIPLLKSLQWLLVNFKTKSEFFHHSMHILTDLTLIHSFNFTSS